MAENKPNPYEATGKLSEFSGGKYRVDESNGVPARQATNFAEVE